MGVQFSFIVLHQLFLKKGIKKSKQATRKNKLPNIDQKLPMLEIIKPTAEITNIIQPIKFI
jgi:coproporphyrinogen III oxidase-like Fe-S oxidoreductase